MNTRPVLPWPLRTHPQFNTNSGKDELVGPNQVTLFGCLLAVS